MLLLEKLGRKISVQVIEKSISFPFEYNHSYFFTLYF